MQVLELAPPYVQTELTGQEQANDPMGMLLEELITEVMNILTASPDSVEICVERVMPLRFAGKNGNYDAFFRQFNDRVAAGAH